MDTQLEELLMQEACNTDHIYLHYCLESGYWVAYERSALNLLTLIPQLLYGKEHFCEEEMYLHYAFLNSEEMERYQLPCYCTLLGDEYMELTLFSSPGAMR